MVGAIKRIMYSDGHQIPGWACNGLNINAYQNGHKMFEDSYISSGVRLTILNASTFAFYISASGDFSIDWGDGNVDTITKTNTTNTLYSHTYDFQGNYYVTITGTATGYNTVNGCIAFSHNTNPVIKSAWGSLGTIFPMIDDVYPENMFNSLFKGCTGLSYVDKYLFANISTTSNSMFQSVFQGCSALKSLDENIFSPVVGLPKDHLFYLAFAASGLESVSGNLFKSISGQPENYAFANAFLTCGSLKSIPADLFSTIVGVPKMNLFQSTFSSCGSLEAVPAGLFSGINGLLQSSTFYQTFSNCKAIKSVPAGVFGAFTGNPATSCLNGIFYNCLALETVDSGMWNLDGMNNYNAATMLDNLFKGCVKLTSSSPTLSSSSTTKLWEKFTAYTPNSGNKPFTNCTLMSDYASVPSTWR